MERPTFLSDDALKSDQDPIPSDDPFEVEPEITLSMFKSIWKNSPNEMSILDSDGVILDVNRLVGRSREDAIGHDSTEFMSPDQREVFRQAIAEVKKTGSAKVVESSQEIDGAQTWFDTTYLPVMMRGKLAFLISIRRNRTPQRRAEQQLVEAAQSGRRRRGSFGRAA